MSWAYEVESWVALMGGTLVAGFEQWEIQNTSYTTERLRKLERKSLIGIRYMKTRAIFGFM